MRLTRIFSKMLVLALVAILGYVMLPYLDEVALVVPFLGLPLVSLGAVFLLALIGVLLYRIVGDILALNTAVSKRLRRIMKGLATEQISAIRRMIYDLILLVVILMAFTIMLPLLGRGPHPHRGHARLTDRLQLPLGEASLPHLPRDAVSINETSVTHDASGGMNGGMDGIPSPAPPLPRDGEATVPCAACNRAVPTGPFLPHA